MALRIGITGGMGSGKSTVLHHFEKAEWLTTEADGLVRQLIQEDSAIQEAIRSHFGGEVLDEQGIISRSQLARRVFQDEAELDWLERLLHPRVRERWICLMEAHPDRNFAIEIPLLFEKNLEKHFHFTVCLEVERATQLSRLSKKGISPEMALPRMARQLPTQEKTERADFVLSNNGSISFLHKQVDRLLHALSQEPSLSS